MASRIAYLFSLLLAAALAGCGGESGEQTGSEQAQTYAVNIALGDGSHLASTVSVYGEDGELITSGSPNPDGIAELQLYQVQPQVVSIVSVGGTAIDPAGGDLVEYAFNELQSAYSLSASTEVYASVNYLTTLAVALDHPGDLSDLLGYDVLSVKPARFDSIPTSLNDSAKSRFMLDALSRWARTEGISIISLVGLIRSDLSDGLLNGIGDSGQLYLGGEPLTAKRYRKGLLLSAVRQAYDAGYLSSEFVSYADEVGSSASSLLAGSAMYRVSAEPLLVSAESHPDGSAVSGDVQFAFSVSEIVAAESIQVILNGSALPESQYSYESENYVGELLVSLSTQLYLNGENTLEVVVTDAIGVTTSQVFDYTFTNGGAVVTSGYPQSGSHVKGRVNVGGSGSFEGATCTISIDGTARVPATILKSPTSCYTAVETTELNDGSHTFQVTATAQNGTSDSYYGSFYVDNTAPTITNVSPASSTYVTGSFNIDAFLSDNLLLWKGNLYHDSTLLTSTLHQTDYTVDSTSYSEGATDFQIVAEDRAGNIDEHTVSVVIDNTAPTVQITYPLNGDDMNSGFTLRWIQRDSVGFCNDAYTAKIYVGGIEYANSFNNEYGTYPININNRPAGTNELRVVVTDCAGHSTSSAITVTFSPE